MRVNSENPTRQLQSSPPPQQFSFWPNGPQARERRLSCRRDNPASDTPAGMPALPGLAKMRTAAATLAGVDSRGTTAIASGCDTFEVRPVLAVVDRWIFGGGCTVRFG